MPRQKGSRLWHRPIVTDRLGFRTLSVQQSRALTHFNRTTSLQPQMAPSKQQSSSFLTKAAGYALGGTVAVGTSAAVLAALTQTPLGHALRVSAAVIVGLNTVGFIATALTKSHKVTDLTGTSAFVGSAWATHYLACKATGMALLAPSKSLLMTGMVTLWGARLAGYLFYRVLVVGEDARLRQFFPKDDKEPALTGESKFPLKLAGFWTVQGMWAWVVLLPVTVSHAMAPAAAITPLGWLCAAGFFAGWGLEAVADYQKFRFKNKPENKDKFITHGAFSLCRYPNYAGEIALWTGLWGLAAAGVAGFAMQYPWTLVSPGFTILLTTFISGIPTQEGSHDKRYGDREEYQRYKASTNMLLPWPRSNKVD
ncbi:hypothetical protein WJX73_005474 [Symbiochloris irregularis]|uniref:Steroid 5-alpha reductase C-terminal domain-containing protein n=1 Tax=Symbiochloris irregularis TaxID=706552 RepID=A0AAW1P9G5_9CHLO